MGIVVFGTVILLQVAFVCCLERINTFFPNQNTEKNTDLGKSVDLRV